MKTATAGSRGEGRCRKHCLHPITDAAAVCCNCGRAVNGVQFGSRGVWEPRDSHGPWYVGPEFRFSVGEHATTTAIYTGWPPATCGTAR